MSKKEEVDEIQMEQDSDSNRTVEKQLDEEANSAVNLEVPDGGYGWVIVFLLFLFNFSTWGANASFSIFLSHYLNNDVFHGVTKVEYGAVGGVTFGSGLTIAPLLNYIVGKIGVHKVILCGLVLQFAGIMLASWSTKIWELFMTQGVLLGVGMSAVAVPNLIIMPQWFRKKRSLAIGLSSAGSGLGGVALVLGLQHIIEIKDYHWALRTQAIVCIVAQGIALLLTRTRSSDIKPEYKIIDRVTLNFGFLMDALWVTFTMFGYVVLLYNLADFTISLGYTSKQGSVVATMVSVGGFFIRPLVGRVCDRFGPVTVNIYIHCIVAVLSWAMWIPARNYATAIAFAFMQGGLMGSVWVVSATITTRIAGLRKMGSCMSTLWIFIGVSSTVSPIVGIVIKSSPPAGSTSDPTQYEHPAIFVGCAYLAAAICLFILRGWLIARDELIQISKLDREEIEDQQDDAGEGLYLRVPPSLCLKKCFQFHSPKKV